MKKLLAPLTLLVLALALTFFWLSRNIDSLVKQAIEVYAGQMTQASVKVGAVAISSSDGKGSIRQLSIGNPPGFKTAYALKVDQIEVELDLASLARDVVHIRRIAIQAPDVIYERGETATNFDAITRHIAANRGEVARSGEQQAGKKLIVELLTVRDAHASASVPLLNGRTVGIGMPDITLRDIGASKGGVTPAELGQEIAAALKSRLSVSAGIEQLMKSRNPTANTGGSSLQGLFK